ncbi:MAG: hypothetical protein M1814_002942 [Vezdaea aestivalis]|nr:MAG: hypothetical protein M1814_002942 [Vezdaea aestivalis]
MADPDDEPTMPSKPTFRLRPAFSAHAFRPRRGTFHIPHRTPLETPTFIPLTSRGTIPHLSPDMVQEHTRSYSAQIALEDCMSIHSLPRSPLTRLVLERPTPPILKLPQPSAPLSALQAFLCLSSSTTTLLTPRRTPPLSSPKPNTASSISIHTAVGFGTLQTELYTRAALASGVDLAVAIADVPSQAVGDGQIVNGGAAGKGWSAKRREKMVDRTEEWLVELVDQTREAATGVLAAVLPLEGTQQALYLGRVAEMVGEGRGPVGLAFGDLESLRAVKGTEPGAGGLPERLRPLVSLRLAAERESAAETPHDVLEQVAGGFDLVTCPWITAASEAGWALGFSFSENKAETRAEQPLPLALSLHPTEHAVSMLPLLEGCDCMVCARHPRAFVNHLLAAKEMLGWALLQVHNLRVVEKFFEDVRIVLERDGEEGFHLAREAFRQRYERIWGGERGEGPRMRGYMIGGGGEKIHGPVWGRFGDGTQQVEDTSEVVKEL